MTSLEIAKEAVKALDSKRGEEIKLLKVDDLTVITDYFVICTGTSNTQVRALADEVEFKLTSLGVQPLREQGRDSASWIVLDYNSVLVHVFQPDARGFYSLDKLWADAREEDISDIIVKEGL